MGYFARDRGSSLIGRRVRSFIDRTVKLDGSLVMRRQQNEERRRLYNNPSYESPRCTMFFASDWLTHASIAYSYHLISCQSVEENCFEVDRQSIVYQSGVFHSWTKL